MKTNMPKDTHLISISKLGFKVHEGGYGESKSQVSFMAANINVLGLIVSLSEVSTSTVTHQTIAIIPSW